MRIEGVHRCVFKTVPGPRCCAAAADDCSEVQPLNSGERRSLGDNLR